MKKSFFLLLFSFLTALAFGQEYPGKPQTAVNDYTNTLSAGQVQQLEQKITAFKDSTSIEIAVVLIKSVGEYDINEYAAGLGKKWGVGNKSKNSGVVVLIALGDRKISIQTGSGMEGALPDIYTQRIIQDDIKPAFKAGQYFEGIDAAINSIIAASKGEYKNDAPRAAKKSSRNTGSSAFIVIIIVIAIIIAIKRGGGGGGGGRQVIGGRGVSDALFWGLLLGGSGRSGGGGGGFGGGFGGGSSGGGGFGGFGGGSFGGGGSSGSW